MEIYRGAAVGLALEETLKELVEANKLTKNQAERVLSQYDKSFPKMLDKEKGACNVFSAKKLEKYRQCDGVYTLYLTDVQFREAAGSIIECEHLKIVCVDKKFFPN